MSPIQIHGQIIKTEEKIDLTKCQSSEYVTLIHSDSSHFLLTKFSFVLILPIKHRRYFFRFYHTFWSVSRATAACVFWKWGDRKKAYRTKIDIILWSIEIITRFLRRVNLFLCRGNVFVDLKKWNERDRPTTAMATKMMSIWIKYDRTRADYCKPY